MMYGELGIVGVEDLMETFSVSGASPRWWGTPRRHGGATEFYHTNPRPWVQWIFKFYYYS